MAWHIVTWLDVAVNAAPGISQATVISAGGSLQYRVQGPKHLSDRSIDRYTATCLLFVTSRLRPRTYTSGCSEQTFNMKIIDKMNASMAQGRPFFSFEFFPPRTDEVRSQGRFEHRHGSTFSVELIKYVLEAGSAEPIRPPRQDGVVWSNLLRHYLGSWWLHAGLDSGHRQEDAEHGQAQRCSILDTLT